MYDWHVAACLTGNGSNPNSFIYYVQRYLPPNADRRYTGEIVQASWTDAEVAERIASAANAGNLALSTRETYL